MSFSFNWYNVFSFQFFIFWKLKKYWISLDDRYRHYKYCFYFFSALIVCNVFTNMLENNSPLHIIIVNDKKLRQTQLQLCYIMLTYVKHVHLRINIPWKFIYFPSIYKVFHVSICTSMTTKWLNNSQLIRQKYVRLW